MNQTNELGNALGADTTLKAPTKRQLIARWQNVIRVLESMTPHERRKHFNMARWGEETECGTVACVAGHCSLDPWFRRRGFKANFENGYLEFVNPPPNEKGSFMHPFWRAARIFFGAAGTGDVFLAPDTYAQAVRAARAHLKKLQSSSDQGAKS